MYPFVFPSGGFDRPHTPLLPDYEEEEEIDVVGLDEEDVDGRQQAPAGHVEFNGDVLLPDIYAQRPPLFLDPHMFHILLFFTLRLLLFLLRHPMTFFMLLLLLFSTLLLTLILLPIPHGGAAEIPVVNIGPLSSEECLEFFTSSLAEDPRSSFTSGLRSSRRRSRDETERGGGCHKEEDSDSD